MVYTLPFVYFKGFSHAAAYIKFDGVDGESIDKDHKGWIDVLSWSWGVSRPTGGSLFPKVEFSDVRKRIDKSSPLLMVQCADDTGIPTGRIEYTKEIRGVQQTYLKIEMGQVQVNSYNFGESMDAVGNDLVPVDSVSLNFEKITMTYIPFDPDTGQPLTPVVGVYNFGPEG